MFRQQPSYGLRSGYNSFSKKVNGRTLKTICPGSVLAGAVDAFALFGGVASTMPLEITSPVLAITQQPQCQCSDAGASLTSRRSGGGSGMRAEQEHPNQGSHNRHCARFATGTCRRRRKVSFCPLSRDAGTADTVSTGMEPLITFGDLRAAFGT